MLRDIYSFCSYLAQQAALKSSLYLARHVLLFALCASLSSLAPLPVAYQSPQAHHQSLLAHHGQPLDTDTHIRDIQEQADERKNKPDIASLE
jgi:cytochrome c-type biogenesis protein CcmH/NrfG